MVFADALKVLNGHPLKTYPWGEEIVEIINAYVDDRYSINLDSKKGAVYKAIHSLPRSVKKHLLRRVINTGVLALPQKPITADDKETFRVGYLPYGGIIAVVVIGVLIVLMSGLIAMRVSVEAERASAMPIGDTAALVRYVSDVLMTISNDLSRSQSERTSNRYRTHTEAPSSSMPTPQDYKSQSPQTSSS